MKPKLEHVTPAPGSSFRLFESRWRRYAFGWHQHPEWELTLIEQGAGMRYVGDSVARFGAMDLVLLGPDLPHTWSSSVPGRAWVWQFSQGWVEGLEEWVPELKPVLRLLAQGAGGLHFRPAAAQQVAKIFHAAMEAQGLARVVEMWRALDFLAGQRGVGRLASAGYAGRRRAIPPHLAKVCRFLHEHAHEPLSQAALARQAGMAASSFARSFRRAMGQTLVQFLHEVRIGQAARELIETERSILQISLDAGFANLSNFNRTFRKLTGQTPTAYRKLYRLPERDAKI